MARPILLDNTVLSNFAAVGRADLVIQLWAESACVTSEVEAEFLAGVESGALPASGWPAVAVIELSSEETHAAQALPRTLGAGERSSLAVAQERRGTLVSDDRKARRLARQRGIPVTGTLGILLRCIERDILTLREGNQLLEAMIAEGYRAPAGRLDRFLTS